MSGPRADRRFFAAALVAGAIALGAPARAADDGYANVFSSVLGSVGLMKSDPPPEIDYRERPPLVLPRDASLPKPEIGGTKHSAAWPQDPDVVRRRKQAAEARAPHLAPGDKTPGITPEEVARGRVADQEPVRPNGCGNDGNHCLVLSPDELKRQSEAYRAANPDKEDTVVAGQEPEREFLTQPPKGLMKAAKAVKATAEAPEKKLDQSSPRFMQQQDADRRAAEINGD